MTAQQLDVADLEVLEFARDTWTNAWARDQAIRERFGYSPTHYHQRLHRIITDPQLVTGALTYDPTLTRRLIRIHDQQAAARTARRVRTS